MTDLRTTPLGLLHFAHSYAVAAKALDAAKIRTTHPDAPVRFLYRHSVELYLKSFLLFRDVPLRKLRNSFGHSTTKLVREAVERGLNVCDLKRMQIEMLEDALADRYIEIGARSVLDSATMLELCGDLNEHIAPLIYDAEGLSRKLGRP